MEDVRHVNPKANSSELHHILERQVALHRNLVDLLREEYAHMGAVDINGLAEASRAKEVILSEIFNLEQLRIKAVERIVAEIGVQPSQATLLAIAEAVGPVEAERLKATRTALTLLVAQAKELNSRNMDFAQGSLARIDEMKRNALGLTNTAIKENYSNSGARQPIPEQGGRLLSTEA